MTDAPLLALNNVSTFYGPVQAHFDLSLQVGEGRIVCLLGGNASGKSTMMKVILGLISPRSGEIRFKDARIDSLPTHRIVRLGIGSVPEARRVFPLMTVRENLMMGAYARSDRASVAEDFVRALKLFPRVAERLNQHAGALSGGEQQMLAMARALMGRPKLILMDEPTMGLSPLWVDRVLELIAAINQQGATIFMVEQNANLALQIAHDAYVLQTGRIVLQGLGRRASQRSSHSRRLPWRRIGGLKEFDVISLPAHSAPATHRRPRGRPCAAPRPYRRRT